MKFLRNILDQQGKLFHKGGKLEKLYPLYELMDTFFFTSGKVTKGATHIRDANDLKRTMIMVVVALIPVVLMALYNTGYQANVIIEKMIASGQEVKDPSWQYMVFKSLGLGFDSKSLLSNMVYGAVYFLPIYMVTIAVGGFWEGIFAVIRKHEINEGFLVTSLLFPLILPPTIPLWQVAVGISFGVVFGKEVFGGVGMNILNPALTGRVFLFFAYASNMSGDKVWLAVDGVSKATPLAQFASPGITPSVEWMDAFIGLIPGSMGETSALACLIGAFILIITGVGSWRTMFGVVIGMVAMALLLNGIGSDTNPMFGLSPEWHFVLGGFAFGMVFMATDPVSSAYTNTGKLIYGAVIGIMAVLIRSINPAYPEGMMLAILFGNVMAPVIDKFFINANIKRRAVRSGV